MACKEWLSKWQPAQLYIMLCLTSAYFLVELFLSHTSHALTLLMDAYHMLCNIIALVACILTIKHGNNHQIEVPADSLNTPSMINLNVDARDHIKFKVSVFRKSQETTLKNTFGWTRIDVVFMLICFVFLASLSFSLVVEALQTLIHIDHHDEMHQPIVVMIIGFTGLLLNGVCYFLIGGYTFHQGSILYITEKGNVILDRIMSGESIKTGGHRLSKSRNNTPNAPSKRQRQGLREMIRDILGCIIVITSGLVVNYTNASIAKFVDPMFSIISATMLIYLSYPYMKESCLILLQTIPDTINIVALKTQLLEHFPYIINIHDFHIWQLTPNKIISTVHIIFENPKIYGQQIIEIKEFFSNNGIYEVTIQPEFYKKSGIVENSALRQKTSLCLMSCQSEKCLNSHCCQNQEVISNSKWVSRECIPRSSVEDSISMELDSENLSLISESDQKNNTIICEDNKKAVTMSIIRTNSKNSLTSEQNQ